MINRATDMFESGNLGLHKAERSERLPLSYEELEQENHRYRGTGGISQENRSTGFVPAYRDSKTGAVYRSRFGDGRPASVHLLDALPGHLVTKRNAKGQVIAVSSEVVSGFLRNGTFFTRSEAAEWVSR